MLIWKKYGITYNPSMGKHGDSRPWMRQYSQCPTPILLDKNTVRVYFASRGECDSNGQFISYPTYVDLSRKDFSLLSVADKPIMPLGALGSFDEFGITPNTVMRHGSKIIIYYTGWTRMKSVPYTMSIGLGYSEDGGNTFRKIGVGPILAPKMNEPFLLSCPNVRFINNKWHMWYVSGKEWLNFGESQEPIYQLAHADSLDGINWNSKEVSVITPNSETECQISFGIFFKNAKWHAIFAYREAKNFRSRSSGSYRLGYASSNDLYNWQRDDSQIGLSLPQTGWDSEMMCYPQVFEMDSRVFLFYCGNTFGKDGFGIAELLGFDG